MRARAARPGRDRRDQEEGDRDGEHPDLEEEGAAVDAFAPSEGHRGAEDEEGARDDRARDGAEDDGGQAVADREQRDDQLRRVAEARVQEPPDAGARVLGDVLGRLADQVGERDQRERREHEEHGAVRMDDVARERTIGVSARDAR